MRFAILGRENSWHVQQLALAGRELDLDVGVVPFERLIGWLGGRTPSLAVGDFNLLDVARVYVRGIPSGSLEKVVFRMDALHRLQLSGTKVLNTPAAIESCVDKYLATAKLQAAGLPTPRTAVCESLEDAMEAFAALGGHVVVKPLFGSEGRGILELHDESFAYRVLRTLAAIDAVLYLQEFVANPGYDYRALVLGGEVLAAMRRVAVGDFRANIARGARAEKCSLPAGWDQLAIRAARAVGAIVAGVDLLPGSNGAPLVLEVNSTPGFAALTQTSGIPIATEIMRFFVKADW